MICLVVVAVVIGDIVVINVVVIFYFIFLVNVGRAAARSPAMLWK